MMNMLNGIEIVNNIKSTGYNRLFERLRCQAFIKNLRERTGDQAFDILADAIKLEIKHVSSDDRDLHDRHA